MAELNNRRIAKNAVMLTVRMLISTVIGLYTSRIVLEALGVEDYGIYGLVGGLVGLITFLNGCMGGATSRFITYELGRNDILNLKRVFSTSLIVHVYIAIFSMVILEIIGSWMINYKLDIPQDRIFDANIVFQLSVLSIAIGFTQVPYTACIIAHEKMDIYAYFEMLNVILKLVIVYLLMLAPSGRLILYAFLNVCVSIGSALYYRFYCIRHFEEAKFSFKYDKAYGKQMLTYSAYSLFGNMSIMVYIQGVPIVLNLFLGVLANAASTIGTTVTGVIKGFSWNVSNAYIPQITKQYACGDIPKMCEVMCRSIQFTAILYGAIAIPFVIGTDVILYLWLGQVPQYSVEFVRMIILVNFVDYLTMSNNRGIQATGNIRYVSFITGFFYLICPFLAYAIMKFGGPSYTPYMVNAIILGIITLIGIKLLKIQIPEFDISKYSITIAKTYSTVLFSLALVHYFQSKLFYTLDPANVGFWPNVLYILTVGMLGIIVLCPISYFLVLSKTDKYFVKNKVRYLVNRTFRLNR